MEGFCPQKSRFCGHFLWPENALPLQSFGMNAPDCACIASGAGSIEIILIGSGPHGDGAVVARYFLCRKLRQTSFDYPLPKQFIAWKQPAAHMAAARDIPLGELPKHIARTNG